MLSDLLSGDRLMASVGIVAYVWVGHIRHHYIPLIPLIMHHFH